MRSLTPSCQQAWREGYAAAESGHKANPYPVQTDEHLSWNDGWIQYEHDIGEDSL